jgi:hypothetical protein
LAQPRRNQRFAFVLIDFLFLHADQPTQVQAAEIANQQVGAQRDQRGQPAFALLEIFIPVLGIGIEVEDDVLLRRSCLQEVRHGVGFRRR